MLSFIGKGMMIGFSIAAPVGPIGILCIHRSLHQGYKWGFITGMGAATADVIYGAIAGFGLTFLSNGLLQYQYWINLIGGLFLLYFGGKILLSKPATANSEQQTNKSLFPTYIGALFLNLTNPITILLFISIFSGIGILSAETSYWHTGLLILGILLGASLWWLILCSGIAFLLRHRIKQTALIWIQRTAGTAILFFAGALLISV